MLCDRRGFGQASQNDLDLMLSMLIAMENKHFMVLSTWEDSVLDRPDEKERVEKNHALVIEAIKALSKIR